MSLQGKRVILYARCSTSKDQKPELQIEEMRRYCQARGWLVAHEIVDFGWSGTTDKRPGLQQLMKMVRSREADVVIVLKLDRLFRSLKHLVTTLQDFTELGVEFVSIKDQIDLTTASGRLLVHVLAAFGEFEAALIRERTMLGLAHAISKGKTLGRPPSKHIQTIQELRSKGLSYRAIAKQLNCSMGVVCRALESAPKSSADTDENSLAKTRVANG